MCVGKHDLILPALPVGIRRPITYACLFSYSLGICTACKNNLVQTNRDVLVFFYKNIFQCLLFEKGYIRCDTMLSNDQYKEYSISTVDLI